MKSLINIGEIIKKVLQQLVTNIKIKNLIKIEGWWLNLDQMDLDVHDYLLE